MKSLRFILLIFCYQFILLSCTRASETHDKCAKIDNAISNLEIIITENLAKLAISHSSGTNSLCSGVNEIYVDLVNMYKEEIEEYKKKVEFCQAPQPSQNLAYQWVDLYGVKKLPSNAVLGGQNVDRLPLHVVRGKGSNSDTYGKLYKFTFYGTDENKESILQSYEVRP
jgi:hypothetical protein